MYKSMSISVSVSIDREVQCTPSGDLHTFTYSNCRIVRVTFEVSHLSGVDSQCIKGLLSYLPCLVENLLMYSNTPGLTGDPANYRTFLESRPEVMEIEAIKLVCEMCLKYR